jgi:outer membrane biogenesis lipoprotein LolB
MKRTALLAIVSSLLLAACAASGPAAEARYSVVPSVQVVEKVQKKRTAQANYQARPGEAPLSGSGGSAK